MNVTERSRNLILMLEKAQVDKVFPGGAFAITHAGSLELLSLIGDYKVNSERIFPVSRDSLFDLASLSKIVGTWLMCAWLERKGLLRLDMRIKDIFPEISSHFSSGVTIGMLMTYTAGLPKETRLDKYGILSREEVVKCILTEDLESPVNSVVNYSNRHMILLGEVLSRIAKRPLNDLAREVWDECGMFDTHYSLMPNLISRAVSTEFDFKSNEFLRGIVHDENARLLDGVAGHAGVFSTIDDMLIFASLILSGGYLCTGEQVIGTDFIRQSLTNATEKLGSSRGLIWDLAKLDVGNDRLIPVHHGFTGTSIVVDPNKKLSIVFLTNAVQFGRDKSRLESFRTDFYREVMRIYA